MCYWLLKEIGIDKKSCQGDVGLKVLAQWRSLTKLDISMNYQEDFL